MKRILAIVSLLLAAVGCAAPPTNRESSAPANANVAKELKSTSRISDDEVANREKAVWDALKKKDYAAFGNMLTSDYLEVGNDAVYDKQSSLDVVKGLTITEATFSDWKVLPIDQDALVVTYKANAKGSFNGQELPSTASRASSAWVNRDGKWLAIYHQESEVKDSAPSPPPSVSKSPAKPTASPMGTPPETSSDAIANEKLIWDALKMKNSEAFAAFLAADSIEVEPDGIYDKAGSVKSISQVDFSKAALSEFKTVKFDNDASLVTYLVKIPGMAPDGERHSTIWVNRGGKWLALFHQGTPVVKAAAGAGKKPAK